MERTISIALLSLTLISPAGGCRLPPPGDELPPPPPAATEPAWPRPTKGFGMVANFPPMEEGAEPVTPAFFLRAATSITREPEPIEIPAAYETVLYEGELVAVIGRPAHRVTPEEAEAAILGYTCGMDGSPLVLDARGERDPVRSLAGKSADGIAPVGPRLLPRLNPDGHAIVLRVNGEVVEEANTRDLIWDPARAVSEISKTVTLLPGDVIFMGARRAVPKMRPGDVVEVEIERIGILRRGVVAEE